MFTFKNDAEGVEAMGIFVATIFKQGITYKVQQDQWGFEITLTGY